MKKITLLLSFTIFLSTLSFAQIDNKVTKVFGKKINPQAISPSGHIRCLSSEYNDYLKEQNPKTESSEVFELWMAAKIQAQKSLQQIASQSGGIIYIPVVVHVIHNGDDYGANENITDEQVLSQITVLNQDFRRLTGTPGFNSNTVGTDTQVEFVLAKVDVNGNPTNGINRVNMCQESWDTADINQTVKPNTIWDPLQYMNMWSVNFTNNQLLGYAQFPESNLAGMSLASQNALSDGVVANYATFGSSLLTTGSFSPPYDKGRTMTHEVGHYLGLRHIWGDNSACPSTNTASDKDFVADTPAANAPNYGCSTGANSCVANPGNDMIENYMDYSDDSCMNIFTIGQKARITTVLNNSPRRATLKTSTKDIAIPLFANDAEVKIDAYCSSAASSSCAPANQHKVFLINRGTSNLTSATINYNVNGAANTSVNWTGNLLPNKYTIVTFSTIQSSGTLNVSIATTNGVTDQRASNNIANSSFSFPTPLIPTNYLFTSYVFNLQGDRWGSETTWNLKNATGTVLYSGGPYSDLPTGQMPSPIIQNWTLPTNGCYTFSILDSYGDGISPGTYSIKTNNGATTVVSGSIFTSAEITSFTNNSLSSSSFDLFDSVTLYPNPTKDIVSISIPQGLEVRGNFDLYNAIGQKVTSRKVTSESDLIINSSNYQKGLYFINLTIGEFTKTLRFIKE